MTKRILLVLTGLVLAAASTAQAQTAQITGRVLDPSDSPVAGGRVTVQNLDTGIKQALKSNAEGYYTAPLLTRGTYQVTAEASGFKTSKSAALPLDEGQVLRLDLRLQIGAVTESVDVVATAGSLSTEATSISTVVSNQRVVDLPLAGRNPLALANLVPGVRPVGEFGALTVSAFDGARASISGGAPSTNNYMIDGVAAENFASGGIQITLSPDATEEFRVITRNASAEYGRTGGGIINITSKAGTNRWQGSIFEFLRNRQLNANNFFANAAGRTRAPFIFNQYGATLGGPLKKDKTFFFFNWEAVKQRQQSTTFRTVPTDLQKSGNFSQTLNAAGAVIAIYDPLTTAADPARPGRSIRTPFPGNVIPSGRINAVSRAMAAYYPTPNQAGAPNTNANNFFGQASAPVNKDVYGIRIDHYLTPSRRIFGRYTYDLSFRGAANFFGNEAEINTSDLEFRRNSAVFNYTDAVTPTFLIDGRLGFNRYFTPRITRSFGFDLSRINMPAGLNSQIQIQQLPRFAPGDVSDIGAPADDQLIQANESYTAAVAGTWLKSAHNVRFGFEHRQYRANNNQASGQIMFFGFGRGFTQGPDPFVASAVSGFGFATFLLGSPGSGEANRSPAITYLIPNYALFVQDDWKLTPRLTINMGLRWEVEGPYYDRFNAISNFDPSLQFRAGSQTLTGGLVYPGTGGLSRGSRDVSYRDFMPRLGVSYQLRPKTVVRAAYGIFYLPTTGINTRLGQTGFSIQTPYIASIDGGLTPAGSLSNPFPNGITMPPGSAGGPRTGLGTTVNGSLRSLKRGYSQQWNMNLQQELPGNWIVELGYMGNRGVNLPAIRDYRYLPAAARTQGNALNDLVDNPYAGIIASGPLAQARVTRATLLNTYSQFLGAFGLDSWGDSVYHAATMRIEKRFSQGLSVLGSYTYSKLIDNNLGNGNNTFADGGNNGVQNWDNLRAERAVSTSDLPQRLVLTASYDLPFWRNATEWYQRALGGWAVNSILTLQSGNVIGVTAPAPAFGGFRPNAVGDPGVSNPNIDGWLNRSAFSTIAPFTFGNSPRNLPRTRTDGLQSVDFSLFKNVRVTERYQVQIRGEFFNLTNTPTFGNPGTFFTGGDFGVIRSLATNTGPRQVQLGLKLLF